MPSPRYEVQVRAGGRRRWRRRRRGRRRRTAARGGRSRRPAVRGRARARARRRSARRIVPARGHDRPLPAAPRRWDDPGMSRRATVALFAALLLGLGAGGCGGGDAGSTRTSAGRRAAVPPVPAAGRSARPPAAGPAGGHRGGRSGGRARHPPLAGHAAARRHARGRALLRAPEPLPERDAGAPRATPRSSASPSTRRCPAARGWRARAVPAPTRSWSTCSCADPAATAARAWARAPAGRCASPAATSRSGTACRTPRRGGAAPRRPPGPPSSGRARRYRRGSRST